MSEDTARIIAELDAWEQREGQLPPSLNLYRRLLVLQEAARERLGGETPVDEAEARDRFGRGEPMLTFVDLHPNWDAVRHLAREAARVLAEESPRLTAGLEQAGRVLEDDARFRSAAERWYAGLAPEKMSPRAASALEMLVFVSLRPLVVERASALRPLVEQKLWRRRNCPVCGGSADIAYLDAESAARWLVCRRCDSPWLFQRVLCPACGTREQQKLSYIQDESGRYRLYLCDECHCYIKALDLRQGSAQVRWDLERVLTLDLDRQALEMSYHPC